MAGVGEMGLVAGRVELLDERKAEDGRVRRVALGLAQTGRLVLGGIVEEDGRITGAGVLDRRVFLDPGEDVVAVVVELLELLGDRAGQACGSRRHGRRSVMFGIHSRSCLGSSEVWAPLTAAQVSGSIRGRRGRCSSGSAMSSWKASQSDEQPPAEPPVAPIRFLSMFHSPAFERRNCRPGRRLPAAHFTGGLTPGFAGLRDDSGS